MHRGLARLGRYSRQHRAPQTDCNLSAPSVVAEPVFARRRPCRTRVAARVFALAGLASFVSFALQAQTNNLLDIPKVAFYFFALWVVLRVVIKQTARSEMESGA